MIFGSRDRFAIEIRPLIVEGDWVFGVFLIWVCGLVVGDESDDSVALQACMNWLSEFSRADVDRFEPGLFDMDNSEIYNVLVDPVFGDNQSEEIYEKTHSRFHISHVGMSSFHNASIVLVDSGCGKSKLVWQQDSDPVKGCVVDSKELYEVSAKAVEEFEGLVKRELG